MREAADILSTSSAMQIRYLDTLTNLSKAHNTSVVFLPPSADNAAFIKDGQGQVASVNALQAQNFLNIASQRTLQ
jgi:hypothetical protein